MEDELTLMDALRVFARRWKLIVAVTLIATIVVAGVLLFAIKPTFTSRATVVVSQENVVPQDLGQLATLMVSQPVTTAATYVDIARDPGLYRWVIEQLQLSGEPWRLTASTLARAVTVTSATDAKDTNMIAIDVKLRDKDLAAAVANALAEQLVERGKEIMVTEQLNSYRAYLRPLLVDIPAQQTALAAKQAALVGVPKVLTTTQSIVNNQTLLDVAKATSNQSVLDLAGLSMVSQQVNPLWQSLTTDISSISADITTKTGLKALCEQIIAQLESPSTVGDSQSPIRIEQRAVPADEKDAGGRSTTVAVTLVAALLLSILLAFLIDYIQAARAAEAAARRPQES
ncbi:MAG: Wzz/FepE/Etk N-terminal domain-containing protein [Caldiserica bacterium]|nr:Wzz/FepE/Etk N-terminal domain-containing protein [Caldisericota bacterium]